MKPRQNRPKARTGNNGCIRMPDYGVGFYSLLQCWWHSVHCARSITGSRCGYAENNVQQYALLGMLDMFSGGALKNFSIVAMGVYPISHHDHHQLMQPVIPALQRMSTEGEAGQDKVNRISHLLMIPLAALSGWGEIVLMQHNSVIAPTNALGMVTMIMCLIAGTVFLVWLGELITDMVS